MKRPSDMILLVAGVGLLAYALLGGPAPDPVAPTPAPAPLCPGPDCPRPEPKPKRPWAACGAPVGAEALKCPCSSACTCGCQGGGCCQCQWDGCEEYRRRWLEEHDGDNQAGEDEPAVDLLAIPSAGRPRNVGGRDGAGLCVFTSIQYAAWYQGEARLKDFQAKMRQEPGGGYPAKVDTMISKYGNGTPYVQYEGGDPAIIELALKTGRVPGITWNGNHMLNCVFLDGAKGAIVDNNSPDKVQWFSRQKFLSEWKMGGGGWAVVLLAPPPPPPPKNATAGRPIVAQAAPREARIIPGGVQWAPPPRGQERWRVNGVRWEKSDVLGVMSGLADDSNKYHLTIVGASREQVAKDLDSHPSLAPYKGRFLIQSYAPDAWEVKAGHVSTGAPTIYLQDRAGKVLHRQDDYRTGAEGLAKALGSIQALRKPDPAYDPSKDPNRAKPSLCSGSVPWTVWALLGVGVFTYVLTRKFS